MKFRLIVVLIFTLLSASLAWAQEPSPTPPGSYVTGRDIYVRSAPTEQSLPVGRLVEGDRVFPVNRSQSGGWVLIRYNRGFGWIRRDLAYWAVAVDALPTLDESNLTPTPLSPNPTETPFIATATPNGSWVDAAGVEAFVRSGPNFRYQVVGQLDSGTVIEPVGRTEDSSWILIRFGDGFAWIARRLVDLAVPLPSLPILQIYALTPSATFTPSSSPTPTSTLTPTATPSSTLTATATFTATDTPSLTPTATVTWTPTATETASPLPTNTPESTLTPSPTATLTFSPTNSASPEPTSTHTPSATATRTTEPSATFTATVSPEPTNTATAEPTATETSTSTLTNTVEPSATPTPTNTVTPGPTATETSTSTLTNTVEPSATPTPTNTVTTEPTATETSTSTPTNTVEPSATPTSTNTVTPEPTATLTATNTSTVVPTETSTATEEVAVAVVPTETATRRPSRTPVPATETPTPTPLPSETPTERPTSTNTPRPTATETATEQPTATATSVPPTETPIPTETAVPTSTATPTVDLIPSATREVVQLFPPTATAAAQVALTPTPTPETTTTTGGVSILPEAVIGVLALLVILVYIGLYWRGLVAQERFAEGFIVETCPVCGRGHLTVETRTDRLVGIPRPRSIVRCTECRSVLRQVGAHSWRYAVDPFESPALYARYNGRTIDEETLKSLRAGTPPPEVRPPTKPPTFVDDEET